MSKETEMKIEYEIENIKQSINSIKDVTMERYTLRELEKIKTGIDSIKRLYTYDDMAK